MRTAFVREVKREGNGQKSAWKFFEVLQYIRKRTSGRMTRLNILVWTEEDCGSTIFYLFVVLDLYSNFCASDNFWSSKITSYSPAAIFVDVRKFVLWCNAYFDQSDDCSNFCCVRICCEGGNTSNKWKMFWH